MTQDEVEQVNYALEYKDYIIGFLTIVCTVIFYLMKKKDETIKRKEEEIKAIQEKLSDKKYNLYHRMYSVVFDLIKKKNISQQKLTEELIDIKKEMFIYAPDDVLLNFLDWNNNVQENGLDTNTVNENMMKYFKILSLIRKDMGNHKTIIDAEDIFKSLIIK
ncbi:hypothetical protein [Mangrovimonas cancribranchiae]|uniref:Uncharacterized protein n=1 Tax=Mangrovimonas cancribranchiae TaxID=3080055 RepID=A0AAU6NWA4_9FLAO